MLGSRIGVLAAFLAALVVVAVQVAVKRPDRLQPDEHTYLAVVNELVRTGVYTDGDMAATGLAARPGRFLAPAYPVFVAALAKADAGLARTLACLAGNRTVDRNGCGSLWTFYAAQIIVTALGTTAIFAIAWMLSPSPLVAWGSLLLVLASGEPAYYARLVLTDALAFTAFYLFLASIVALTVSGRLWQAVAAGAVLGLAALARPSYVYLLYAVAATLLLLVALRPRTGLPFRLLHGPVVLAAGLAVLAPWMVRNWIQFGDSALTAGYGAFTLAQRLAYNAMTWPEWAAAWLFWFPDVGDDLARALLPPALTGRLGWHAPETFYQTGLGAFMTETRAAAGSAEQHLGYLIRTHLLGDPVKHVAVTLVLAWRGLFAGKWLGVVALLLAWPVVAEMWRRQRLAPLLALGLPLAFMVALHAFVSVSIPRYNTPLIALFCFVIAFAAASLWQRLREPSSGTVRPGTATGGSGGHS